MKTEEGRDLSIDFVKGIAILCVIFLHNMPGESICSIAYIGQAVPLFLLVSSYLAYGGYQRKGLRNYYSTQNMKKMLNRIFIPFFILIVCQCLLFYFLKGEIDWYRLYKQGGFGPGSYYPWIYLQCWLILPFIIFIVNNQSLKKSFVLFVVISILVEWGTCVFTISDDVYRLLFYRYLFLLYLGCIIMKYGVKLNVWVYGLAFVSLLVALIEIYTPVDLTPFLTNKWKEYHWVTYFYTMLFFLLLVKLYSYIKHMQISAFFVKLGNCSYEVFLFQMFVFCLISMKRFLFIENEVLRCVVYVLTTIILSIVPVFVYKEYIKKLYVRVIKR